MVSKNDAVKNAEDLKIKVQKQGVDEKKIAFYWGFFTLLFFSSFNFIVHKTAGIIISGAAVASIIGTLCYVLSARSKVRAVRDAANQRYLIRFWILVTLWCAGLFTLAMFSGRFSWDIPLPFVLAGILGAIPMLVYRIKK